MISRVVSTVARTARPTFARLSIAPVVAFRSFGAAAAATGSDDVVVPTLVDSLEWVLDSPPNVHQFDEPPIIVEIEHLDNLVVSEDH